MFKLVSLLSLIFVLAACQSSQKSADRDPAQSKTGNGEVGSVSMSGTDYMNCESLDKKNHYRISIMEEGKELILNLSKDANEIDSRYMSKTTWQQLTNQEIPFDITFSAYAISIKRFYSPTSSYLAGEVRSHGPTQKITCEEPRRTSQYSSPPRSPAQTPQGNGEVGSVDMGDINAGNGYYIANLYVPTSVAKKELTKNGAEARVFIGMAGTVLGAKLSSVSACSKVLHLGKCSSGVIFMRQTWSFPENSASPGTEWVEPAP